MRGPTLFRVSAVALAAVLFAALGAQTGIAQGGEPEGTITIRRAELKRLIQQEVARIVTARASKKARRGPPGPQGPAGSAGTQGAPGAQGPAGAAPVCQGNGSGDVMVSAGAVCVDKYEVSVWSSPTGGTQYGATADDYPCNDNGQDCTAIYAR